MTSHILRSFTTGTATIRVLVPVFVFTVIAIRHVPFLIPFTVVPMTRQMVFDDVATTAVTLAPEGTVILPKTAIDFSDPAFFLVTVGATFGATEVGNAVAGGTTVVVGAVAGGTTVVVGAGSVAVGADTGRVTMTDCDAPLTVLRVLPCKKPTENDEDVARAEVTGTPSDVAELVALIVHSVGDV